MKDYLYDIWEAVATTAKGMRITARYGVDPRETITLQYPEERWEPSERFRGFLYNDIKTCTSCTMCVRVCPVDCISLESVRGADKKMVLASYDIDIGRCMYCGLCVEVCPPKSLVHTSGYEKASTDRGELILHFIHEDAGEIKARVAKQVAEAAAKAEAEKAKAEAEKAAKATDLSDEAPAGGKAETAKDGEPDSGVAKKDVPQSPQPVAPAFAAGNPESGGAGEKTPAEEAEKEPSKPQDEGGEEKE
ncbi:MAG: NADH-quinone oxidoreductase subunit I [Deltaproteobacteria bacterium]|nr:NADH-quinone oxidoreductase subunit I [Deltaproteobacteria bacterium]